MQRRVAGRLWIEAGASVYVIVPAAFAAARLDFKLTSVGDDSFHVRPALGAAVTPGVALGGTSVAGTTMWGTADIDFVWRRHRREGWFGEFGFKIGAVVPVGVGSHPFVMPRIALLFGWQF